MPPFDHTVCATSKIKWRSSAVGIVAEAKKTSTENKMHLHGDMRETKSQARGDMCVHE